MIFGLIPTGLGLVGYDCSKHTDKVTYLQDDKNNCSTYQLNTYQEEPWRGTVLQIPLTTTKHHRTCSLVLKTYTMYCTYSGNPTQLELEKDDFETTNYQLTGAECSKAWEHQLFIFQGVHLKIKVPGITKILIGSDISEDGFCLTTRSTSQVIKGHIELIWSPVTEWTDIDGNPQSRELDDSKLTWIENRTASTTQDGIVVLSNSPPTSICSWEQLYQGDGKLLTQDSKEQYVVIPSLPAGFRINSQRRLCNLMVSTTEDSSIFLINTTALSLPIATNHFKGRYSTVISSGITGLSLLNQLVHSHSSKTLLENQCILESMVRENIIQQAMTHPHQAALLLLGQLGWTIVIAGNGVVIKRCKEVTVSVVPQSICYTDIPINIANSTHLGFIHPVTRVISSSSFQISCQDDVLPIFSIRGKNYQLNPKLSHIGNLPHLPSRLSKMSINFTSSKGGLYSHEILETMDQPDDHMTRREEVGRQLLKMGDGSFHHRQDSAGVLGNMVGLIMDSAPGHWLYTCVLIFSILSIILNVILWIIIIKSKLWLILFNKERIAAYQAQLLSSPC
ncbi:hypothetical protein KM456_gp1 [Hubei rhabdo-like virus 6]|uniref:Glycoprotein n=1 Tax=Hubei rhabdo-like virus 6 TaxID=1923190 RepID=A0A1L3KMU6_9MONO|nr:hypothetical protein KM456_gp1 [Hubei rhabdo-like virus 6]APG78704.1 hypothetical protein [Hubei rhabdo-like virus 6]